MAETETARAMTLEEFASISAALEAGLPRDEILLEAGFSAVAWSAAQERWLATLAEQATQGKLRPSRRYVEMVGAKQPAATARARKMRRRLPGQAPLPPEPPIAPRLTTAIEKLAPTALRGADAPARMPYVPLIPAPAVAGPPSPLTREERDDRDSNGTIAIAPLARKARVLPFAEVDGANDRPATPRAPRADGALPFAAPVQTATSATETLPSQLSPLVLKGGLPFAASVQTATSATETLPSQLSPLVLKGGLPFLRPAAAPPPAAPPTAAPPPAVSSPPQARLAAAVPEAARATPYERWSLADYSDLCACVRVFPTHVPWIQSRFGLTPESWTALHVLWQQRFQREPGLKEKWQRLIADRVPYWKRG